MHIILHLTVKLHYCVKFCSTDVEVVALGTPLKKGVSLGPTNFFPINTNLGSRIEVLVIRARNPPDVVLPEYNSKSGSGIVYQSLGQIGSLLPKSVSNNRDRTEDIISSFTLMSSEIHYYDIIEKIGSWTLMSSEV